MDALFGHLYDLVSLQVMLDIVLCERGARDTRMNYEGQSRRLTFSSFSHSVFFIQLCSSLRLMPQDYQNYKSILIKEYEKHGSLRLAQARTLIRIDVNKTRKMYNFFVEQGWVKQPDG